MSIKKPKLESLSYKAPQTTKRAEPNTNLMKITEIQGLVTQINDILYSIEPQTDKQKAVKAIAIEEINLYESTTLNELNGAFE